MEAYRDYDEFKSYINSKIKEAESEYRENYKSYILTEQDKRIKDFLDTLYCIKNVTDEDAVKLLENSIIEIAFLSKKTAYMYIKIFNHKKLNPKLQKTTPLWYVLSKILEEGIDANVFYCPSLYFNNEKSRCVEGYVLASNSIVIDIDELRGLDKPVYNCPNEEIIKILNDNYDIARELVPKYVSISGRGVHIIFEHPDTILMPKATVAGNIKWNRKMVIKDLAIAFRADTKCTNLSRLFRFPYSRNYKYGVKTRLITIDDTNEYSQEDIQKIALEHLEKDGIPSEYKYYLSRIEENKKITESIKKKRKNQKAQQSKKSNQETSFNGKTALYTVRKNDLLKLFYASRNTLEGNRNNYFFIFANTLYNLGYDEERVVSYCSYLNDMLVKPLPQYEIDAIASQVDKKKYKFKHETIGEMLNISDELAEKLNMESRYTKEGVLEVKQKVAEKAAAKRREKKRNAAKKRREEQIEGYFKILDANHGKTVTELMAIEGLPDSYITVRKIMRLYNEKYTDSEGNPFFRFKFLKK